MRIARYDSGMSSKHEGTEEPTMTTVYIVNVYSRYGRPIDDLSCEFSSAELGDEEALRQARAAFDWYATRGEDVRLLKAC
jgi:hypothetical protein